MEAPLISVVVLVYKVKDYLEQCVSSILAQSLTELEVLLIDDGSPDECPAICDRFARQDSRVRVIHKENGGRLSGVLCGLSQAAGTYIGFVDGDDWVRPEMFGSLYRAAAEYGADLVECGYVCTTNGPDEEVCSPQQYVLDRSQLEQEVIGPFFDRTGRLPCFNSWSRWNKLFRTDLLRQAMEGCVTGIELGEDCLQLADYLLLCKKAVVLKGSCFYCYRRNPVSITMDYSRYRVDKYEPFIRECRKTAVRCGCSGEGFLCLRDDLFVMDLLGVLTSSLRPGEKRQTLRRIKGQLRQRSRILHPTSRQGIAGKICLLGLYLGLDPIIVSLVQWFWKRPGRE